MFPFAAAAIRRLNAAKYPAIVISNQSGVGRGYFPEALVRAVHELMTTQLAKEGAHIDALYYCPHKGDHACACRKPKPGMLERAAREHGLDLRRSFVIGDRYGDIQLAHRVGARAIMVRTGYRGRRNSVAFRALASASRFRGRKSRRRRGLDLEAAEIDSQASANAVGTSVDLRLPWRSASRNFLQDGRPARRFRCRRISQFGDISRVSREAPVLILRHRETQVVPGGGANAANNLAALGSARASCQRGWPGRPRRRAPRIFPWQTRGHFRNCARERLDHTDQDALPRRLGSYRGSAGSPRRS